MQHNTAQHSTAQCNTTQYSTAQHSTAQLSSALHSTAQHSTAQHCTTQYSTAQHSTAQHNTAQHNTVQHNISQRITYHTDQNLMRRMSFFLQLSTFGRCEYEKTCTLLISLFDQAAQSYQELRQNSSAASTDLAIQEGDMFSLLSLRPLFVLMPLLPPPSSSVFYLYFLAFIYLSSCACRPSNVVGVHHWLSHWWPSVVLHSGGV